MIKPSIGRVVWFTPSRNSSAPVPIAHADQPLAALVSYVHSDRLVNLGGFDANGAPFAATSVTLLQDDDIGNSGGYYAEWMPFQKGQAVKTEAVEAQVESPYAPHQQRVLDEKAELDGRLTKLDAFFGTSIFNGLDEEERERLAAQSRVMGEYSAILGDRIAAFTA